MAQLPFVVVSTDEIMDAKDMWGVGHPTQEDWDWAYSEAYRLLKEHLAAGEDVLWDGACLTFEERETIRKVAQELGSHSVLVYVRTAREEVLRRRTVNQQTPDRGHVSDDNMSYALRTFEEPTSAEQPLIFEAGMNPSEFVSRHLSAGKV